MLPPGPSASFPASLVVRDRNAVVIGDDDRAVAIASALLAAGALVRLVTSETLQVPPGIEVVARGYVRGDLAGAFVAACTLTDAEIVRAVLAEAAGERALLYLAEDPGAGSFTPLGEGIA